MDKSRRPKPAARCLVGAALLCCSLVVTLGAQSFAVVSIKPSGNEPLAPGYGRGLGFQPGGRYFQLRMAPLTLILSAFSLRSDQLDRSNLPGWVSTGRYDIDARLKRTPGELDQATRTALLRSILVERFKIKTHTETREENIFALVVAKSDGSLGPALRRFEGAWDCDAVERGRSRGDFTLPPNADRSRPVCASTLVTGSWRAGGVTMENLASSLSGAYGVSTRVVDETGLDGRFDFDLHYTRQPSAATAPAADAAIPEWPPITTALEDQLGLKLVPRRVPTEILVIDHIEPPTPD